MRSVVEQRSEDNGLKKDRRLFDNKGCSVDPKDLILSHNTSSNILHKWLSERRVL
jgi:hypothetical protein